MSGNAEQITNIEPEEIRRVRYISLGERLWAITRLGITAFFFTLLGITLVDGVGMMLYGRVSGMTFVPVPIWIFVPMFTIFLFILWGVILTIQDYGGGRIGAGLKLPFKELKKAVLIATGKETVTEEDDYDMGY